VRGEYGLVIACLHSILELPPRARRIRVRGDTLTLTLGTTSACAENTSPERFTPMGLWNYLRVRGEYTTPF